MEFVPFTHVMLDASLSDAAAEFWAAALDAVWEPARPGSSWAASLVPQGGDAYVHRAPAGAPAPALALELPDVGAATERLVGLGATRSAGGLRSPGGLPLLVAPSRPHRRAPAARWPDGTTSRLVQVCLDCPAEGARAEAEFWRAATGWEWQEGRSEFVCHLVPPTGSLQLLVQRRASADPPQVTLHLDLGAGDREAEASRLVALGARRVGTGGGWIVLTDPDGRVFCATGQPPEAP